MSAGAPTSPAGNTSPSTNESFSSAGRQSSTSSYAGGLWNMYFNGKSAISEMLRRDPKLRGNTPAYVLGRMHEDETAEHVTQWVNMNVKHIHYFSYRNRIPTPLANGMDHDAGWGCMIRTGQMMLCEALRRCLPESEARNCQSLFCDVPTAPFGIHAMTQMGVRSHIPVGQWFSPTGLAHTVKRLVSECPLTAPVLGVVIAQDGAIRREDISNEFIEGKFCLVLVPVMAGRDKVPVDMQQAVLETFKLERTLGIVGGRPKQSYYFVGAQADLVFYLDPHTVQSAYVSADTVGNVSGVRGTMPISDIDPSMLLCFLLTRNRDLEEWEQSFEGPGRINSKTEYPMFSIIRRKPSTRRHGSMTGMTSSPPASRVDSGDALPTVGASPASNIAVPLLRPRSVDDVDPDDDVEDDCAFDYEVEKEVERELSPKLPQHQQQHQQQQEMVAESELRR